MHAKIVCENVPANIWNECKAASKRTGQRQIQDVPKKMAHK